MFMYPSFLTADYAILTFYATRGEEPSLLLHPEPYRKILSAVIRQRVFVEEPLLRDNMWLIFEILKPATQREYQMQCRATLKIVFCSSLVVGPV